MFDLLVRGGMIVNAEGTVMGDVGIRDGRIAGICSPTDSPPALNAFDATGMLVIPGGIEPHVHASSPVDRADGSVDESFPPATVSRAALHGGTTTLMDFAMCRDGMTLRDALDRQASVWHGAVCDYSHHIQVQAPLPASLSRELPDVVAGGFPSIKVYTTSIKPGGDEVGYMDLGSLWTLMRAAADHGATVLVHAEDDDIVMHQYREMAALGRTSYREMPYIHNAMAEELAIRRVIDLAWHVQGVRLYFVHVGTARGADAVAEARAAGRSVHAETLHHVLTFTAEAYDREDGVTFHTYPSLRTAADQDRLWRGLADGTLSTIATDELGTTRAVKVEQLLASNATGGHVGVETRLAVAYTEGVSKRGLTLERFVQVTSTNAAKIFGMYPRKGAIRVGSDADLVIFDPNQRRTLRAEQLHGSDYSIWDGWETHGWPKATILRGTLVMRDDVLAVTPGQGRRVPRSAHLTAVPGL